MQASTLSAAYATQHTHIHILRGCPAGGRLPHGGFVLALTPRLLKSSPTHGTVFPSQCGNVVEAVPSTPHSCLANLCPTHCSHANNVLPRTQILCVLFYFHCTVIHVYPYVNTLSTVLSSLHTSPSHWPLLTLNVSHETMQS